MSSNLHIKIDVMSASAALYLYRSLYAKPATDNLRGGDSVQRIGEV